MRYAEENDDWICGESYDHSIEIVHEDDEVTQWVCTNCGAEGWEDA